MQTFGLVFYLFCGMAHLQNLYVVVICDNNNNFDVNLGQVNLFSSRPTGKLIWKLVSSPGEAANGSRNKAFLQGQEWTNHFQDDWSKHFGLAKYVVTSLLYDVSQIRNDPEISTNRVQYPLAYSCFNSITRKIILQIIT